MTKFVANLGLLAFTFALLLGNMWFTYGLWPQSWWSFFGFAALWTLIIAMRIAIDKE